MKITKGPSLSFTVFILFSLLIHAFVLAGMRGVNPANSFSPPYISVTSIETETPRRQILTRMKDLPWKDLRESDTKEEKVPAHAIENKHQDLQTSGTEIPIAGDSNLIHDQNSLISENKQDIQQQNQISGPESKTIHEVKEIIPKENSAVIKPVTERLKFDLYWLGIYVGSAVLEAVNDKGTMKITSQVHSAPVLSTFYKVDDYAESRVVDGVSANFRIIQHEGKYRSNKETIFDVQNKKITFFNYLKEKKDEHPIKSQVLWDVISGFYYLRTQLLEVGKTIFIDVFDSNKFLSVEVNVLGKERLELSDKSKIDTVIVKPILKSEGLFQKKGDILIWLTDDENKTPVKIETEVPVGKVVAKLKDMSAER